MGGASWYDKCPPLGGGPPLAARMIEKVSLSKFGQPEVKPGQCNACHAKRARRL